MSVPGKFYFEFEFEDPPVANHVDRGHAWLSPSGSNIWLNCPRSARLSRDVPRRSSKWADEGTKAHELAENLLKGNLPHDLVGTYPDEMVDNLESYIRLVQDIRARGGFGMVERIEERVNLDGLWPNDEAPESVFGTADYVAVIGDMLTVVDLKYGLYYVVEVEGNTQLMIYALGAWLAVREEVGNIRSIQITVVQPRAKHQIGTTRWYVMDLVDLLHWAYETLVPTVELIASDAPDEDLMLAEGAHCKWCPAATGNCPAKHAGKQDKARSLFDEVAE